MLALREDWNKRVQFTAKISRDSVSTHINEEIGESEQYTFSNNIVVSEIESYGTPELLDLHFENHLHVPEIVSVVQDRLFFTDVYMNPREIRSSLTSYFVHVEECMISQIDPISAAEWITLDEIASAADIWGDDDE